MRKTAIFALCGLAMVSAASVTAQAPAPAPAPGEGTSKAERMICRTFRANGSRLGGERACHTAAEWADLRRQARENVDRIQTRQSMNADPTG